MTIVTVRRYRANPYLDDKWSIDSAILGEKWCSFFLKTDFCRILPFRRIVNGTTKLGYNGLVYIVSANNREIIYNSNYDIDHERYIYVRDFVKYVLNRYKYNNADYT